MQRLFMFYDSWQRMEPSGLFWRMNVDTDWEKGGKKYNCNLTDRYKVKF